MKQECIFVILGATGNLSKKKLIPSIYRLIKNKKINNFSILGIAGSKINSDMLINQSKKYIKNSDSKILTKMKNRTYYFSANFNDKEKFFEMGNIVRNIEKKHKLKGNRMFYLATLPHHFKVIANNLSKCSLTKEKNNWVRVVFEKPFGQDLKSAKKINQCITKVFKEDQIYRIDHYLGKELVQNIAIARFANMFLEPIWNNKYIKQIQIILSENIGIEERGVFYDKYGVIRDVFQNHMLQMLTLSTMNAPKKISGNFIRDEKVKILKKIKTTKELVIGQYKGYTSEKFIKKNSKTETFAALKLFIDSPKWKGVPIYMISGKKMKDRIASVHVEFKEPKCLMFGNKCDITPNYLTIRIQPNEGLDLQMNAKIPGKRSLSPVKLDFCHSCAFGPNTPEAYENLFTDIIRGDQSVFVRSDEIEEQWKIIDKIKKVKSKLNIYKEGTYPETANKITNWHLVTK